MTSRTASRYAEAYQRACRDPEGFWAEAAQAVDWIEAPKTIFDPHAGVYGRWFAEGVCNTCWNAVDRHVMKGRGEQPAIIYDSPLAGQKRTLTYHRLQVETQVLAAILREHPVGDTVRLALGHDGLWIFADRSLADRILADRSLANRTRRRRRLLARQIGGSSNAQHAQGCSRYR